MKQLKKLNKKYGMLPIIIGISILFKILEWIGQSIYLGELTYVFDSSAWFFQILFISLISSLFYLTLKNYEVKKKIILLIPTMAYFTKEIYNTIFIYSNSNILPISNLPIIFGLFIEPLVLLQLNKWLVKDL